LRLRIVHELHCQWDSPVKSVIAALRLMPRDHEGQTVVSWRIEPSLDGRLRCSDDCYGNLLHHFQAEGSFEALTIRAEGVIEAADHAGVVRGAREACPPMVHLRDTPLTAPSDATRHFAERAVRGISGALDQAHALMGAVASRPRAGTQSQSQDARSTVTKPLPAMARESRGDMGRNVEDQVHLLVAAARAIGLPARSVAGHADCKGDLAEVQGAHAWAEIHIDRLGWVAFDPVLGLCPSDRHVRVAVGLDLSDVAPIRLARSGSGSERLTSFVKILATN
jgi:transglutaminase-like putative cysteine protease